MAVRKVMRSAAASVQENPTAGPNWNSIRVDSATNLLMVGTGASGSVEFPVVGNYFVVSGQPATVTLTAAQSGATVLFDALAGIVYTLPSNVVGLYYTFVVTVAATSNSDKVITNLGTQFIQGTLIGVNTGSTDALLAFSGVAATSISINMPAAGSQPSGGVVGSYFTLECVSTTLWQVTSGVMMAGTTYTTPFAAT